MADHSLFRSLQNYARLIISFGKTPGNQRISDRDQLIREAVNDLYARIATLESGKLIYPVHGPITGSYTIDGETDGIVEVNNQLSTATITLVSAASVPRGTPFEIKALHAVETFDIFVKPVGTDTIDGIGSSANSNKGFSMNLDANMIGQASLRLYSNGSDAWRVF